MSEIEAVKVGSLAASISETHPRNKSHLVFLNTSDVLLGKVLHQNYTAVHTWPGQAKKSIAKDDILFSEIRPSNGRWAYIDFDASDFVVSTKLMVIRANKTKIIPKFLYHFLTSKKISGWLQHLAESRSGTFPQITFDQVAELEISLPPLQIQSSITSILDGLDEKIDLNRRMNETLEATARAIFNDWFVDFGPTRARMEGRTPYLASKIWEEFPKQLDDEGKPEGWLFVPLTACSSLNPESWSKDSAPDEINYLDLASVKWGVIENVQYMKRKDAPSRAQRILRAGDTVVGTVRPGNGSFSFIDSDGLTASTGFAVLRPKAPFYREFVYLAATSSENIKRLTHLADGAAYPAVRPEIVGATEVCRPNERILAKFSNACAPILDRIERNKKENHTLTDTRDFLLPKLMSGEIRIKGADVTTKGVV